MRAKIITLAGVFCALGCGATPEGNFDAHVEDEADAFVEPPRPDARQFPDAPLQADAEPQADGPSAEDARAADARAADAGGPDAGPLGCFTAPGVKTVTTSTIYHAETYAGASDSYVFNSNQCSDMPDSAERIYTFELSSPLEWYAETRCGTSSSWDCELVLTRDGCSDANVVACETTAGDETMRGTLQPGRYALFVEGDNPDDPAIYDLMVNFNHTAGLAQCASTTLDVIKPANCQDPILDDPSYHLSLDGVTMPSDKDDFFVEGIDGCTHDQDHVGGAPDKVYKLVLPAARKVTVELDTDWDALLYITSSTSCGAASSVVACSDDLVGSTEEITKTLAAGTWYIIVDGFGEETFGENAWGAFNLDVRVYDDACNE